MEEWILDDTPLLRIGAVEGDLPYLFHRVRHAMRFRAGGVAVFDGGSGEIRFFGADGEYLHSLGGLGQGPGEFRTFSKVVPIRDTLFVYDSGNGRISVITSDGRISGEYSVLGLEAIRSGAEFVGLFDGSDAVVLARGAVRAPSRLGYTYQRDSAALIRVSVKTQQHDTLIRMPGNEESQWASDGGGVWRFMSARLPFGHTVHAAALDKQVVLGITEED